MTKQTISDKLLAAERTIESQQRELETLRKELANAKSISDYLSRSHSELNEQLSLIHTILDALPTPPPRKYGEYGAEHKVATRLCVLFAQKVAL